MAFLPVPLCFPPCRAGRLSTGRNARSGQTLLGGKKANKSARMRESVEIGMRVPGDSVENGRADNALMSEFDETVDLSDFDDGVVDILGGDYDLVEEKTKKVRMVTSQLLEEINAEPENNLASDVDTLPPIQDDDTMNWVRTVVRAGDTRKAINPIAIRVMRVTYITSFMVALTGRSAPQLRAIANLVEENMFKEHGVSPKRTSGIPQSGWILLDYGDMIVNIFSPEQRANYNLEGLWKDGEIADISECISQAPVAEVDPDLADESLDDWL